MHRSQLALIGIAVAFDLVRSPVCRAQIAEIDLPDSWPRFVAPGHVVRPPVATLRTDSVVVHHRRAAIVGGIAGAAVGGLTAAAIILNATAYHCVTVGPPCPYNPHRTARVVVISSSTVVGAAGGAWLGCRLALWHSRRRHPDQLANDRCS